MKKTAAAWLIAITGLLAYEGYAVVNSTPGDTLSEAVWKYGQHPLIAFAIGVLVGHFWWQRKGKAPLAVFLALPLLLGADRCSISWPQPTPSPTAAPTAEPTPEPTPTAPVCPDGQCILGWTNAVPPRPICGTCPTPAPHPTPTPTPTPAAACPKPLAPGAEVYLNAKPYGQGFDSTVRVKGDPEFCRLIHGTPVNDCHLEGWPTRVECEMELIHGCPVWQFTADGGATVEACVDDHDARASCDHFGSVEFRDDPQTPTSGTTLETLRGFEGQPLACGLQRDVHGPMAGFFVVAHGKGQVRACRPDGRGCSPWRPVDH